MIIDKGPTPNWLQSKLGTLPGSFLYLSFQIRTPVLHTVSSCTLGVDLSLFLCFSLHNRVLKVSNYIGVILIDFFPFTPPSLLFSWSGVVDMVPCTAALWMNSLLLWRCLLQPTAPTSLMNAPSTGYHCWSMTTSPALWPLTRGQAQRDAQNTCWSWTTTRMWVVEAAEGREEMCVCAWEREREIYTVLQTCLCLEWIKYDSCVIKSKSGFSHSSRAQ